MYFILLHLRMMLLHLELELLKLIHHTQVNHCTWKPCVEMKCHHQWRASEHQMKFQYPQKSGCCCQNLQGSIAAFLHSQPIDTTHPECPTWSQAQAAETKYTVKQFLQTDNFLSEITIPQRRVTLMRDLPDILLTMTSPLQNVSC
jgi:hypothetical protein